eukprot:GHVT01095137.1.p1 GENE.GHVT01095137.1~~GHVT01095137.1.p1  ORF type:complete len:123 (+),score=25.76 GHVT01095137.1:1035-1403(+)
MWFGQLVVGPPGSGKTTFCHGMVQLCRGLGRRHVYINIDPANDAPPCESAIDVQRDLINVEAVMEKHNLGPNGALIYCMEYLLENFDWLVQRLKQHSGTPTKVFVRCGSTKKSVDDSTCSNE